MHMSVPLSLLAAVGGAMTRTNAMALLGATSGVVQGVNEGAENKYEDAMQKWQVAYQRMKDHQETQQKVYSIYEQAYAGRLDAADKAVEHTRALMNDKVDAKQLKMGTDLQLYTQGHEITKDSATWKLAIDKIYQARAVRNAQQQALSMVDQQTLDIMTRQYMGGMKLSDILGGTRNPMLGIQIVRNSGVLFARDHANDPQYANNPQLLARDAANFQMQARSELAAANKATQAAAQLAGKIEMGNKLLDRSIPLARQASADVKRLGKWVPLNQYAQSLESMHSNPQMAKLNTYTETVLNDYNSLAPRGQASALADRERWRKLLNAASSEEAYNAQLDAMERESEIAHGAAQDAARLQNFNRIRGLPESTPAPGEQGAPTVSNW
jgi:hypothetical protein